MGSCDRPPSSNLTSRDWNWQDTGEVVTELIKEVNVREY